MPLSRAQTENEQPQQTQSEDPSRIMSQISESIDELGREIDADRAARDTHEALRRLDCAPGAVYDAQGRNGCMANTRVEIMRDILAWSRDPSAPAIFWLSGMAGTGKTSIAWSLCGALQTEGRLGGSFFCSRASAPQHGDITRVIPSLARLLALQINPFKSALVKRLNADPDVAYRRIRDQINFLLLQPLDLLPRGDIPLLVLVIDAMDECFDKDATRDMLGALVAASPRLPLKFFVTSRPEQHIRPLFDAHVHRILKLHQIEQTKVDTDIRLYFETTLQSLVHPPSRTWFTQDDVERLVQQAHGLFIFASTAVKYIRRDPTSRLPRLLTSSTPSRVATKPLDDMYVLILNEAAHVDDIEPEELDFLKRLLALVFVVHYPLSVAALAEYLCVTPARLRATLDHLHAVLHVPEEDEEQEVSVLHSSFADFLTSADRAPRRLRIQPSTGHRTLAYRSFARFRRIGEPGALDQAILSIKAVAEQTADTDPEQIVLLKSLAAALQARMSRDGAAMFAPIERFFSFLDGDLAPTRKMLADSLSFFDRNGWKSLRILGDRFERFDDATDQIFDDGVDFLKVQLARLFKSQARARASTTANKIGNKLKQWL